MKGHPSGNRGSQNLESYRAVALVLINISVCLAVSTAISPCEQPTFRSDTNLVSILATVHDETGRIVTGLTKDDFSLLADGKPQLIHDFTPQSDLPLTLALLVDTSGSMRLVRDLEQQASATFLKHSLRLGQDRAMILHFHTTVEMLSGLENSRKKLDDAVRRMKPTPAARIIPLMPERTTALYDAIFEAASQLKTSSGRKAIVVLTDGLDVKSGHSLNDAVEAALRSDAAVYSILVSPWAFPHASGNSEPLFLGRHAAAIQHRVESNLARGRLVLHSIATQTGGYPYEANASHSFKSIYAQITEELRNQYRIGFLCNSDGCGPGYHSISLTAKKVGLVVQSRRGFVMQTVPLTAKAASPAAKIDLPRSPEASLDDLLLRVRDLSLHDWERPVGFVADERIECYVLGNGEPRNLCEGAARIVFDRISRTIKRQIAPETAAKLKTTGITNFAEFGVELSNIFRILPLRQFQRTGHGATSVYGLQEYDFIMDENSSAWQIWNGEKWLPIPYLGAIWVDPSEGIVVRFQRTSVRLPPSMPLSLIRSEIEFAPGTIGETRVSMLPTNIVEWICDSSGDLCTEFSAAIQSYTPQPADPPQ